LQFQTKRNGYVYLEITKSYKKNQSRKDYVSEIQVASVDFATFGLIFAVGWIISFVWSKKSESKIKIIKIAKDQQDLHFGITTLGQYQVA
jgi:hypothetical protein